MRKLIGSAFALASFAVPAFAAAQESQRAEEPESLFGEVIDVRVVNLEAVVTDREGNRVPNLKPEDFKLEVDGKEVPIQYFTEVREGQAQASPGEVALTPGLETGKSVGTSYLVFVDDFFPLQRDRNQVLDGLVESVSLLGPEDRMAVVAFTGRRLEMLSTWSQSQRELVKALERAKTRRAGGYLYRDDSDFGGEEATDLDLAVIEPETNRVLDAGTFFDEVRARRYADVMERRLEKVVMAVNAALRTFAKPPGRKVMLLLSGGWPYSPLQYRMAAQAPIVDQGADRGPKILRSIFQTANLVGYTLYPIDVPGAASDPRLSAASGTVPGDLPHRAEGELHTTLQILAEETGGQAFLDGARLSSLPRVVSDTRSYYWLGFSPQWKGDDADHKIKLDVLPKGLKVRSREGFQDLSRKALVSFQVESALMLGLLPGSQPLDVRFGPNGKEKRGKVDVPVTIVIPMDAVTMVPHRGEYVAELQLRVAALDEGGNRNELPVIPVRLAGPQPPQPGQHATYEVVLKLRAEDHDVVVALHDPPSDRMLSAVHRFRYTKR